MHFFLKGVDFVDAFFAGGPMNFLAFGPTFGVFAVLFMFQTGHFSGTQDQSRDQT